MPGPSRIVKHTVVSSGLHDADIRPPALLDELMRLSIRDAAAFFPAPETCELVPCPACGNPAYTPAFEKHGFSFIECPDCASLYVSPRPNADALSRYYAESEASQFRAAQFNDGSAAQRRRHLLRANAAWMARVVEESGLPERPSYADVRTYTPQLFDEIAEHDTFGDLYSIEPWSATAGRCNANVADLAFDDTRPLQAISAFEKLEHQYDPAAFLAQIADRLIPGGLLFLTTRTASGFDLQVLWDKAPYIYVPEHLNLLSIAGLEQLVQRAGLELIELSTPGQLDVELVIQAINANPATPLPRFLRTLLEQRGPLAYSDLQAFLQKHRLSSHVRLAVRKPG